MHSLQKPPVRGESLDSIITGLEGIVGSNRNDYLVAGTKKSGKGVKVATRGDSAVYLKTRRTSQHDYAVRTLELIVEEVKGSARMMEVGYVRSSIQNISDLLARAGRGGIKLKAVQADLQSLINAHKAISLERKTEIDDRDDCIGARIAEVSQAPIGDAKSCFDAFAQANELQFANGKVLHVFDGVRPALEKSVKPSRKAELSEATLRDIPGNQKLMRDIESAARLSKKIFTGEGLPANALGELDAASRSFVGSLPARFATLSQYMRNDPMYGILTAVDTGMTRIWDRLDDVVNAAGGNASTFAAAADKASRTIVDATTDLQFAASLCTDESYLASIPEALRESMRNYGEMLQQILLELVNPQGALMTALNLVQMEQTSPGQIQPLLAAAVPISQPAPGQTPGPGSNPMPGQSPVQNPTVTPVTPWIGSAPPNGLPPALPTGTSPRVPQREAEPKLPDVPAPLDMPPPLPSTAEPTLPDVPAPLDLPPPLPSTTGPALPDVPVPPDMPPPLPTAGTAPLNVTGPAPVTPSATSSPSMPSAISSPVKSVAPPILPGPTDIPRGAVARNSRSIATGLKAIVKSSGKGMHLHGSTAGESSGFQVASHGGKELRLDARPATSVWGRLTGRPSAPQHSDEAIVALKLIVKTVREDKGLKNRNGVQGALAGIEDIVGKAINSKKGILLSDIEPHFQALVEAEAGLRSDEARTFANNLKPASERQKRLDDLADAVLKPYQAASVTDSHKAAAVGTMITTFNLRENENVFALINTEWNQRLASHQDREAGLAGSAALQDRTLSADNAGIERTVASLVECSIVAEEFAAASKNPEFQKAGSITNDLVDSKYKDQKPETLETAVRSGFSPTLSMVTASLGGTARTLLNSIDALMKLAEGDRPDEHYTRICDEVVNSYPKKMAELRFIATVLTDKAYLDQLPAEYRTLMLRCGEAAQRLLSVCLAPDSPFRAAFHVAQHGAASEKVDGNQVKTNAHRAILTSAIDNARRPPAPATPLPALPV